MFGTTPPTGFTPSELSSLINRRTIDEHAGEAAFLWLQRQQAVTAPNFRLEHLNMLDSRVQAHLAALHVAGRAGWDAALRIGDPEDVGSIFVLGCLAFDGADSDRMRHVLAVALAAPAGISAVVAALAWLRPDAVRSVSLLLLRSPVAAHRVIGSEVLLEHAMHDTRTLEQAATDTSPMVRECGLRAIGETCCSALQGLASRASEDAESKCAFRAAWSLALMGDGASAERAFHLALEAELPTVRQAVEVAMRRADPRWVRGAIRSLAASSRTRRLAIIAAGAFGDPAVVPWLIKECDDELIGGVAGEAVSMITGVDLRRLDLDRDAVEPSTSLPLEDQSLPQPDPDKLAAWWRAGAARYATGQRHLAGQPITSTALVGVLRTGYQRQRRAAAIELTTIAGAATLFRVGARADRQLRSLAP